MAKLPPFVVLVRDLPLHHKRFEIGSELVAAWLKGLPMRDALGAPESDPQAGAGTAVLDLYAESANVHATGTFDGWLMVACSRCVNPVKLELHDPVHVSFLPAADMPAEDDETEAEEGAEVGAEDLDVFVFDGEKVDLEPLFREQFVLAIPYAPLCSETCKGLCPQCGIDRNLETCQCEPPIDPRLAALKGLKIPP
jgi:uncharacterized protein